MPAHESIHEYYLHQHQNIEHYLELCMSFAEAELVHELRLSIKKLRAFHKLAEQLFLKDKEDHIHIKHRVRDLYKIAGQLRDTQVQLQLLASFGEQNGIEYPEFQKWLLRREKKRMSRFGRKPKHELSHATTQVTHQKIGDGLALATDETILNGAGKVLNGLYTKAKNLAAGEMSDRNLHMIRTITKQMRYILNIMHHSYPDFMFTEVSFNSLREIEAVAGNWHDCLVRIELLGKYIEKSEFKEDSEKSKYQKFYAACKAELDIAYAETYQLVRNELLKEQ